MSEKRTRTNVVVALVLIAAGGGLVYAVQSLVSQMQRASPDMAPTTMPKPTAIHAAASKGDMAALKSELARGVDINMPLKAGEAGRAGMTPLICAAFEGSVEAVTMLLDAGARPDARSDDGRTALMFAAGWGSVEKVRAILEAKCFAEKKFDRARVINAVATDGGWTALMFAAARGEPASVRALIDVGADVQTRNKWRQTALMAAVRASDATQKVPILLEAGADVSAKDNDENTPLNIAAATDVPVDVLRMLLDKGAAVDSPDFEGVTPLMKAAQRGDIEQVKLLLERGASKSIKDTARGWTAEDWVKSRGEDDEQTKKILELLAAK